jgi:hypothetical protein
MPFNVNVTFCPTQNSGVLHERSALVVLLLAVNINGYFCAVAPAA